MNDNDNLNIIRSSSSSLNWAPSWSLGLGADTVQDPSTTITTTEDSPSSSRQLERPVSTPAAHQAQQAASFPKLSLQIPTAYLTKKDASSYHVYQLTIKASTGEEWSVYRRYSQFHALHQQLKSKDSTIGKLLFPPKRRLNSKASTIVQDRRTRLEEYIRALNSYIERLAPNNDHLEQVSTPSSSPSAELVGMLGNSLLAGGATSCCGNSASVNSLSDSACSIDQVGGETSTMSVGSAPNQQNSNGLEHSRANSGQVRSLFHQFISLNDRRDEQLDSAETN